MLRIVTLTIITNSKWILFNPRPNKQYQLNTGIDMVMGIRSNDPRITQEHLSIELAIPV